MLTYYNLVQVGNIIPLGEVGHHLINTISLLVAYFTQLIKHDCT